MPGELLPVVGRLYQAVAQPSDWPAALAAVSDLLSSDHVLLWVGSGPTRRDMLLSARVDHDEFARRHVAFETMRPEIEELMPEGPVTRNMLIDDRDYERDGHYNEVVRHVGGFHALFARGRGAGGPYKLAACRRRSRGNFGRDDAARLALLMPHLANAAALRLRLGMVEAHARATAAVLDRLAEAIVLVDAACRPLFVNRAARALDADEGLDLDGGRLVAATAAATRRLRDAVQAVAASPQAAARRVLLGRAGEPLPLLATVLPVARLEIALPGMRGPVAAIVITRPERPGIVDREAIAELFGLTPRETDVAALLAEGLVPEAIAARLRLGRGTVASHLKRAFLKTDTHAQVELAALVGRFVSAVG